MQALAPEAPSPVLDAVARPQAPSWQSQILNAASALASAQRAHLILLDNRSHAITWLHSGSPGIGAAAKRVAAAMTKLPGTTPRDRIFWDSESDGSGTLLMIEAAVREGLSYWIALEFDEAVSGCRARLAKTVAPLAAMLKQLWQSDIDLADLKRRQLAVATALDDLDYGIIAVRADHAPVVINKAGQAMLGEDGDVQLHRGLIRPCDSRDAMRFHVALDSVIAARPQPDGDGAEAFLMLLAGRKAGARGNRGTILLIAPSRGGLSENHPADEVAALIYVFRPESFRVRDLDPLCHLFGLSRAETRLVSHLLRGRTVTEAAEDMRIKLETARTYLKQVFAKTETHRQADLMTLLHQYLPAMCGRFRLRAVNGSE